MASTAVECSSRASWPGKMTSSRTSKDWGEPVNKYGIKARRHWETFLPSQLQQLSDPEEFFQNLGETAEMEVDALADALAGEDPPGETYSQKTSRLATARQLAENQIARDLLLVDPEDEEKIAQLMG